MVDLDNKYRLKSTNVRIFFIPAVIYHQGDEMQQVTFRRTRFQRLKNNYFADMMDMSRQTERQYMLKI